MGPPITIGGMLINLGHVGVVVQASMGPPITIGGMFVELEPTDAYSMRFNGAADNNRRNAKRRSPGCT